MGVNSQITLDSVSKEQIQKLEIMCPNSDRGCEWEEELGKVKSHRSVCPKERIQCRFEDIGCHEMMLRDETGKHNEKNKDKHLQCAILTIDEMKETDTDIRQQMKQLEDDFRSKIEELRLTYEGVIRRLKEEISLYPPVVVSTIDLCWHNNSLPLTVHDIVHNRTFMSTGFYSHPHGFKLSVIFKCSTEALKIRVVALQQENPALKWPCKGVAIITLQPKGKDAQQFDVEFDIPRSTAVHEIEKLDEESYTVCSIPQIWYGDQYSTVTLKIERINLN